MARSLEGQVSLVTGAGRGIGRATALALSDAGSSVVLGARTMSQVEEAAAAVQARGGEALAVQLDVTDSASVQRFVAAAMDRFGHIENLVNNAGSNNGGDDGAIGQLWEINPEAWWRDIEINFRGTFLCSHFALPHMLAGGKGHIVNLNSLGPATLPWPYDSAYACAKAAVARLTDSLAAEVRDKGVFVFTLSPGRVRTQIIDDALTTAAGQKWLQPMVTAGPHSEILPEVPAGVITFLLGGEADGLTGRFLHATWDMPELARQAAEIVERDGLALRLTPAEGAMATSPSRSGDATPRVG